VLEINTPSRLILYWKRLNFDILISRDTINGLASCSADDRVMDGSLLRGMTRRKMMATSDLIAIAIIGLIVIGAAVFFLWCRYL